MVLLSIFDFDYSKINCVSYDTPAYDLGCWHGMIAGLGTGLLVAFIVWVRCRCIIYKFNSTKRGFQGLVLKDGCQRTASALMNFLHQREKQAKRGWLHGEGVPLNGWHEMDPDDKAAFAFLSQFIYRLNKLGLNLYLYEIGQLDATSEEEGEEIADAVRKTLFPLKKNKFGYYNDLFSFFVILNSVSLIALAVFVILS